MTSVGRGDGSERREAVGMDSTHRPVAHPTNPHRWSALALVLLLAAPWLAGCRYSIVGDSVTFDARDELEARGADVSAFGGVNIALGRERLRALAQSGRRQIVIELGLMDVSRAVDQSIISRQIRRVLRDDVASVPCVVWLDLPVAPNVIPGWPERARTFNQRLRAIADEYGRQVAGWSVVAESHPEWFREDRIHLIDEGQRRYARFVKHTVDQLC